MPETPFPILLCSPARVLVPRKIKKIKQIKASEDISKFKKKKTIKQIIWSLKNATVDIKYVNELLVGF